jgi:hypothetical protein
MIYKFSQIVNIQLQPSDNFSKQPSNGKTYDWLYTVLYIFGITIKYLRYLLKKYKTCISKQINQNSTTAMSDIWVVKLA